MFTAEKKKKKHAHFSLFLREVDIRRKRNEVKELKGGKKRESSENKATQKEKSVLSLEGRKNTHSSYLIPWRRGNWKKKRGKGKK